MEATNGLLKEHIRLLKETSSREYIEWLYNYVSFSPGKEFDDESVLYEKQTEDTKKAALLSYFLSHVINLAREQSVPNTPDEDNEFEELNYDIKIFDKYFNISNMVGQGSITFIREIEQPSKKYVVVLKSDEDII